MKLEDIQVWLDDKDTKRVAKVAAKKMANGDGGCSTPNEACLQTFRMRRATPTAERLMAVVHLVENAQS